MGVSGRMDPWKSRAVVLASFAPSNTLREGPCGAWTVADYLEGWIDGSKCGRGVSASKLGSESYSCVYAGGWGREMVPANSLVNDGFPQGYLSN